MAAYAILYRADGSHCDVAPEALARPERDDDLLWIDIDTDGAEVLQDVCARLDLPADVLRHLSGLGSKPLLRRYGDFIVVHSLVVVPGGELRFDETELGIAAGQNMVITLHQQPVAFIDAIRRREHGENRLGHLNARTFVAALLDWQLDSYHAAVAEFECAVESLEEAVLDGRQSDCTRELVIMRRGASQLRRMLAPHRVIFSSLSRPDFQPDDEPQLIDQFQRLEAHFDRAMDAVENARELVIGSFGLFSNQVALHTNDSMRLLTFATVVIGALAVIAGALGMNFKAALFTSSWGFWVAIATMAVVTALAIWWGRRKDWI
ncbi:MAG: CorA family divalent cation transporter [Thermomonas sp.]